MDAISSGTPDATEQRVRRIVAQFNAGQPANTLIVTGQSDPPVAVACVVLAKPILEAPPE